MSDIRITVEKVTRYLEQNGWIYSEAGMKYHYMYFYTTNNNLNPAIFFNRNRELDLQDTEYIITELSRITNKSQVELILDILNC